MFFVIVMKDDDDDVKVASAKNGVIEGDESLMISDEISISNFMVPLSSFWSSLTLSLSEVSIYPTELSAAS